MKPTTVKTEKSAKEFFTSHAGHPLLGQALKIAQLETEAKKLGSYRGTPHSDVIATYLGLLATGKSDFEAAEGVRGNEFFKHSLGISGILSSSRLRQRMDDNAMGYSRVLDACTLNFLKRSKVTVTPLWTGHVPLDMDLFPQDNSRTKKEGVSYTYKGFVGYGVMAAYLGREGWCLTTDLKHGSENGQLGFGFVLDRILPVARALTTSELLLRLDSGHDSIENRVRADKEEIDFIIKWNPRKHKAEDWFNVAEQQGHIADWENPRPGKQVVTSSHFLTVTENGVEHTHRLVVRVIKRTIDSQGRGLIFPEYQMDGWWTSLELADRHIIALYRDHATSEQFHGEYKTDMDLERLPSGKFETNTLVMVMGTFVYNVLRWIGLEGLIGGDSPVRHQAKRRRIRTVMQELYNIAGKVYCRSRQLWLRFSANFKGYEAYEKVHHRMMAIASG